MDKNPFTNDRVLELGEVSQNGRVTKMKQKFLQKQMSFSEGDQVVMRKNMETPRSSSFNGTPPIPLPRSSLRLDNKSGDNCPLQLYKYEKGSYFLDIKTLKNVFGKVGDKLIAIYSISGKFRSGKSFILNIFLKYLKYGKQENWIDIPITESFKYRNSDQRVTTGIWIYSEPIIKRTSDGREVAVFLMDTQGWHDDQTSEHDTALVFSLSALLSSVMIYNSEKRIGEDDLQFFQCFSSHAKLIDKMNNDQSFQKLVFLIRDWQFTSGDGFEFGYYDDFNSIKGKNFKTERIDPRDSTQSLEAKSIREIIAHTYDDISAYLMPHPGSAVQSDRFSSAAAEPQFVEHLKKLSSILFNDMSIVPKRIGGQLVTGRDLIASAENWVNEFNYEHKNNIYDRLNAITGIRISSAVNVEAPFQMAFQTSIDYFEEKIKKYLNNCKTIQDFQKISDKKMRDLKLQSEAIFYASKKLKDGELRKKYQRKLKSELDERERNYKTVIEVEISLKQNEVLKIAKQNELAQIIETNEYEEEEEKYGQIEAEINKLVQIENEKKEIIRQTLFDFQETRRKRKKSFFRRIFGGFANMFHKQKKDVKTHQKLIDISSDED